MAEYETVARVSEIPDGQGRAFEVRGKWIAVFNTDEGYYAIDDACPHAGASLADGQLIDCTVICSWHAWRFDVRDGTWCDNRRLKTGSYPVQVIGEEIQVKVP